MDVFAWKDFVGGSISGITGIIAGQPLDTIKVRLQTQSEHIKYDGIRDCAWKMIKKEGPLSLFKGMSSPLMGLTFINAVVFFTYAEVKRFLEVDKNLSYRNVFLAGCASGLTSSILVTPIELVKIRVQANESRGSGGSFQTARKIVISEGFRGLYRGLSVTAFKEIPSYGVYFVSYEFFKNSIFKLLVQVKEKTHPNALTKTEPKASTRTTNEPFLRQTSMFFAGGLAGVVSWAQCYPVDTIKSRVQSDPTKYKGAMDCVKQTYKAEGIRGFFGGFRATMYRAFFTNAVTFLTYEIVVDSFHYYSKGMDAELPPPIHPVY